MRASSIAFLLLLWSRNVTAFAPIQKIPAHRGQSALTHLDSVSTSDALTQSTGAYTATSSKSNIATPIDSQAEDTVPLTQPKAVSSSGRGLSGPTKAFVFLAAVIAAGMATTAGPVDLAVLATLDFEAFDFSSLIPTGSNSDSASNVISFSLPTIDWSLSTGGSSLSSLTAFDFQSAWDASPAWAYHDANLAKLQTSFKALQAGLQDKSLTLQATVANLQTTLATTLTQVQTSLATVAPPSVESTLDTLQNRLETQASKLQEEIASQIQQRTKAVPFNAPRLPSVDFSALGFSSLIPSGSSSGLASNGISFSLPTIDWSLSTGGSSLSSSTAFDFQSAWDTSPAWAYHDANLAKLQTSFKALQAGLQDKSLTLQATVANLQTTLATTLTQVQTSLATVAPPSVESTLDTIQTWLEAQSSRLQHDIMDQVSQARNVILPAQWQSLQQHAAVVVENSQHGIYDAQQRLLGSTATEIGGSLPPLKSVRFDTPTFNFYFDTSKVTEQLSSSAMKLDGWQNNLKQAASSVQESILSVQESVHSSTVPSIPDAVQATATDTPVQTVLAEPARTAIPKAITGAPQYAVPVRPVSSFSTDSEFLKSQLSSMK
jgi:hypothetical protein